MKSFVPRVLSCMALAMPLVSLGGVVVYNDPIAFAAAAGGQSAPLPAPTPLSSNFPVYLPPSPLSITGDNTFLIAEGGPWALYARRMIVFGWERFRIDSSQPLYALGFSVYEPTSSDQYACNTTCVDSTFTIKLFSGTTQVGSTLQLAPANNQWVFWGVSSDVSFDRVSVYDEHADNEFFASVVSSSTPSVNLTLAKDVVPGCKSASGTVSLSSAASSDTVIALADTLAAASIPASLTIPAGALSRNFSIATSAVAGDESGTVSATLGGSTVNKPLTVRRMSVLSLAYKPGSLIGTNAGKGTVKLECAAAPGPISVDLVSAKPEVAGPVAASITIPQGLNAATFDIDSSQVLAKTKATITATANGLARTKSLSVYPMASLSPNRLAFGERTVAISGTALTTTLVNKGQLPFGLAISGTAEAALKGFTQSNDCPATLGPAATCTITANFTALTAGSVTGKLYITTTATTAPIALTLTGTGVLPPP